LKSKSRCQWINFVKSKCGFGSKQIDLRFYKMTMIHGLIILYLIKKY